MGLLKIKNNGEWLNVMSDYAARAITAAHNLAADAHSSLFNLKQNSTDNSLTTTSKNIVGSINELNNDKQSKTDNSLCNLDEQGRVVQSILAVDTKTHTHSNKSILDTIGSDAGGLYWED